MADGVHHGQRLLRGANHDAAERRAGDGIRYPDFRPGWVLKTVVLDVGYYADNLEHRVGHFVIKFRELRYAHLLAEGVFSRQILFHKFLIYYR